MKNILRPVAKSILTSLELTTTASATNEATHKKIFGSGIPH